MKKIFYIFIFTVIAIAARQSHAQSTKIDSIKKNLLTAKEDTNKVNTLNALVNQLISSEPQKAFDYAQQALKLAEQIKWEKGIAKSEHSVGYYYFTQADYANTLEHYLKALKKNEKLSDKTGIAKSLGNVGNVYASQANYPKALDYYFKALKLREELGSKNLIGSTLGNIGLIYASQANYPKALDYYFKALKVAEELGSKNFIANTLGNIGGIYMEQASVVGDPNASATLSARALDYYFKALKMKEELGNKNGIATVLSNIGIVYDEQANYPKALDYYFKALKMTEELGDKKTIAISLGNIGSLYTKTGKFAEAEKYLKQSLALCDTLRILDITRQVEQFLSHLYDITGRTKLAFAHYKKYIAARDSIANEENTKKQTRTAMQYEFDKKQTADSVRNAETLKQENLKHEQQIKQQKIYTYGGAIGFALMLVVAGVSFRAYRNKQKANEIISHQKKLVEEKQKEVLDSIYYARRIQRSLLTSEKYIARSLNRLRKG